MASDFELSAQLRTDLGKGASRRLRRLADLVPAVLYGANQDPVSLSIAHKDLHKSCENEAFFAHIISLNVDGKKENAIIKDLQRHPAKDRIMHADFQRVRMDVAISVEVPFHFTNEEKCVGVKQEGGTVSHTMSTVQISCLPGDLPEYIEVDVEALAIGDAIHLSELKLPEGVTIPELELGEDHDQVVVTVIATRATIEEDEDSEAGEAAESGGGDSADSESSDSDD
ncbi:MAG: 50S ribosomal protein L25/general stress protein Ctc [Pseudomonadales bacterium]|jgi:large subunit ribosomal protein L25